MKSKMDGISVIESFKFEQEEEIAYQICLKLSL